MNPAFERELRQSLYVHYPLPLHREKALEAGFKTKALEHSEPVWTETSRPYAAASVACGELEERDNTLVLTAPLKRDVWPEGATEDGDYCNYGEARLRFSLRDKDLRNCNRLHFFVRPRVNGAHVTFLCGGIKNEGEIPVPDPYFREGNTVWDLENGQWNECFWEFSEMARDKVTQLDLYIYLSGGDAETEKKIQYEFKDIYLERVAEPEVEHGWHCRPGQVTFSTVGYWPQGEKTAVANTRAAIFSVINSQTGETAFTGPVKTVENARGKFQVLDFTALRGEGEYHICLDGQKTETFAISRRLCEESVWRAINFLYCERCGTVVPRRHGMCHMDITAVHNGEMMSYAGGWHDAGDVSQQTAQTAEVACALVEAASRCKKNSLLHRRLLEEAGWGLDFVLRTRFGDGYRMTSAGATRWTDNRFGNFDDIHARIFNHAYENFLFAGIEAYASVCFGQEDPQFAWALQNAARQDFAFAEQRFAQYGAEAVQMFEHTYNSGPSQYYACIAWSASQLYRAAGGGDYAETARKYGDKLLTCQETGEAGIPCTGFFYRDESHKTIVHFNHQAREHQFAQALCSLCETQPQAPQYAAWLAAARRYGDYLLGISGNTAPYGMMPAGIHRMDEAEDREIFPYLHVTCEYESEKENYVKQLQNATYVDENHVLRNFPVWFSFRGNNAVLLSMGKSASLLGKLLNDEKLTEVAREQLYWVWGKNPFGQSLMYGSGSSWCAQYAVLCGEAAGEIPVGIETRDNEDVPYWPQNNNATFREVWTTSVGHWLRLAADLMPEEC